MSRTNIPSGSSASPIEKHLGQSADLDVIDQYLEVAGRFLIDAGCGNMHLSRALADRGAALLAIDPDPIQAEKNRNADTIHNVGFVETGADSLPVEPASIDGILYPYSLHHVPQALHARVFAEALRVLKPDGFIYVMEPVCAGGLNDVMKLFHDESEVSRQAQLALEQFAIPFFAEATVLHYSNTVTYKSWDHFANRFAGKSFNTRYTEQDVRRDEVREALSQLANR